MSDRISKKCLDDMLADAADAEKKGLLLTISPATVRRIVAQLRAGERAEKLAAEALAEARGEKK